MSRPTALLRKGAIALWAGFMAALSVPEAARAQPGPDAVVPRQALVSAAHPVAVEAGLRILRQGGSAMDAAVAIEAMLGLVEPQSSGLGGGAFIMYFDAATGRVSAYDGRETAPAVAAPDMLPQRARPQ